MEDNIKNETKNKTILNCTSFNENANNTFHVENKNCLKEDFDEKLNEVLYKRAMGYSSEEVIEEYSDDNGELKLIKRKVTKKDIPPDISAVKILLEKKDENEFDLSSLSDEDLENMRNEVMLEILKTQKEEI